jgi:hypothetical protein
MSHMDASSELLNSSDTANSTMHSPHVVLTVLTTDVLSVVLMCCAIRITTHMHVHVPVLC